MTSCPAAMSDGAARLLQIHGGSGGGGGGGEREQVFREAYRHLTSRDPAQAWTSGQWMTERSGGSDVRGTETVATPTTARGSDADGLPLGPCSISGFKWFSSATDARMTILLAQTLSGQLSAFFAPMHLPLAGPTTATTTTTTTTLNGVTIQRLKPKLGTRPVPTAELVLRNMRAWPIGDEGKGTREIATVLNITRVHTALSAMGQWGRGLGISRAFARVRCVQQGRPLSEVPAHVRGLARNSVGYAAMLQLAFFVVAALGVAEHPGEFDAGQRGGKGMPVADAREAVLLGRLVTPVAKAMCSKYAIAGLQECMESLGGVGYLEDEPEFNVARLFRDANVNSIWEGTTDVMAEDVVRVIHGREGGAARRAFDGWIEARLGSWGMEWAAMKELVERENQRLKAWFGGMSKEELAYKGRDVLESIAWIVAGIMLVEDARRDADRVATEIARRWILRKEANLETLEGAWKHDFSLDRMVAFPPAAEEMMVAEAKL
jgi:alkylation response protein AidB-like acyl-CoA dehydrogenase